MSDFFHVVSMNVASNPVARAIAKKRIESSIRTFLVECYLLEEGSDQGANYQAAARVLTVAVRLCEQARRDVPGVLRGALSCCEQASKRRFVWKLVDAVAIDKGITAAQEIVKAASAAELQRAWAFVIELEREVEAAA